jgi:hypothetical protein
VAEIIRAVVDDVRRQTLPWRVIYLAGIFLVLVEVLAIVAVIASRIAA